MKLLFRLCLCVFLPIVVILGLVFMLTHVDARGMTFAIGVPIVVVLCFISWMATPSKPKAQQSSSEKQTADGAAEQEPVKDGAESTAIAAADTQSQVETEKEKEQSLVKTVDEAKAASERGMLIGIGFFAFLVADVIAATVLLINKVFVGAIVCAAIFGVLVITIVTILLIKSTISEKTEVCYAKKIIGGKVKSCALTDKVKKSKSSDAMMASSVAYKVVIAGEDGRQYGAVSERSYEIDEQIYFGVMSKKRAIIVDESEKDSIVLQKVWSTPDRRHNFSHRHHYHH